MAIISPWVLAMSTADLKAFCKAAGSADNDGKGWQYQAGGVRTYPELNKILEAAGLPTIPDGQNPSFSILFDYYKVRWIEGDPR